MFPNHAPFKLEEAVDQEKIAVPYPTLFDPVRMGRFTENVGRCQPGTISPSGGRGTVASCHSCPANSYVRSQGGKEHGGGASCLCLCIVFHRSHCRHVLLQTNRAQTICESCPVNSFSPPGSDALESCKQTGDEGLRAPLQASYRILSEGDAF